MEASTRAPGTRLHNLLRIIRPRGAASSPDPGELWGTSSGSHEVRAPPVAARSRDGSRSPRRAPPEDELFSWFHVNEDGELNLLAKRNDEISLKELSAEEAKTFEASDALEWAAILSQRP